MKKNIVLVTVDSLRADHCGHLGPYDLTPTLDTLASDGVSFTQAIAPGPRTPSSVPVTFTGEFYQRRANQVYQTWEEKRNRWRERRERIKRHVRRHGTVAARLQDRGYTTVMFTANPWTAPDTGFANEFDEFHQVGPDMDGAPKGSFGIGSRLTRLGLGSLGRKDWFTQWPVFFEALTDRLETLREPYFLWVFLMDPHQPYFTPPQYRVENSGVSMLYSVLWANVVNSYDERLPPHIHTRLERSYRDTVRATDSFLRHLRDATPQDTAFIVHADHGEAFFEHGTYGHRLQLYEENVHVPLVVHDGETVDQIEAPVTLVSLPEMVTSIADYGYLAEPASFARRYVVSRTEEAERESIRSAKWKYVRDNGAYISDEEGDEFYDLESDPKEQTNLIEDEAVDVSELRALLDRYGQGEEARIATAARDLEVGF